MKEGDEEEENLHEDSQRPTPCDNVQGDRGKVSPSTRRLRPKLKKSGQPKNHELQNQGRQGAPSGTADEEQRRRQQQQPQRASLKQHDKGLLKEQGVVGAQRKANDRNGDVAHLGDAVSSGYQRPESSHNKAGSSGSGVTDVVSILKRQSFVPEKLSPPSKSHHLSNVKHFLQRIHAVDIPEKKPDGARKATESKTSLTSLRRHFSTMSLEDKQSLQVQLSIWLPRFCRRPTLKDLQNAIKDMRYNICHNICRIQLTHLNQQLSENKAQRKLFRKEHEHDRKYPIPVYSSNMVPERQKRVSSFSCGKIDDTRKSSHKASHDMCVHPQLALLDDEMRPFKDKKFHSVTRPERNWRYSLMDGKSERPVERSIPLSEEMLTERRMQDPFSIVPLSSSVSYHIPKWFLSILEQQLAISLKPVYPKSTSAKSREVRECLKLPRRLLLGALPYPNNTLLENGRFHICIREQEIRPPTSVEIERANSSISRTSLAVTEQLSTVVTRKQAHHFTPIQTKSECNGPPLASKDTITDSSSESSLVSSTFFPAERVLSFRHSWSPRPDRPKDGKTHRRRASFGNKLRQACTFRGLNRKQAETDVILELRNGILFEGPRNRDQGSSSEQNCQTPNSNSSPKPKNKTKKNEIASNHGEVRRSQQLSATRAGLTGLLYKIRSLRQVRSQLHPSWADSGAENTFTAPQPQGSLKLPFDADSDDVEDDGRTYSTGKGLSQKDRSDKATKRRTLAGRCTARKKRSALTNKSIDSFTADTNASAVVPDKRNKKANTHGAESFVIQQNVQSAATGNKARTSEVPVEKQCKSVRFAEINTCSQDRLNKSNSSLPGTNGVFECSEEIVVEDITETQEISASVTKPVVHGQSATQKPAHESKDCISKNSAKRMEARYACQDADNLSTEQDTAGTQSHMNQSYSTGEYERDEGCKRTSEHQAGAGDTVPYHDESYQNKSMAPNFGIVNKKKNMTTESSSSTSAVSVEFSRRQREQAYIVSRKSKLNIPAKQSLTDFVKEQWRSQSESDTIPVTKVVDPGPRSAYSATEHYDAEEIDKSFSGTLQTSCRDQHQAGPKMASSSNPLPRRTAANRRNKGVHREQSYEEMCAERRKNYNELCRKLESYYESVSPKQATNNLCSLKTEQGRADARECKELSSDGSNAYDRSKSIPAESTEGPKTPSNTCVRTSGSNRQRSRHAARPLASIPECRSILISQQAKQTQTSPVACFLMKDYSSPESRTPYAPALTSEEIECLLNNTSAKSGTEADSLMHSALDKLLAHYFQGKDKKRKQRSQAHGHTARQQEDVKQCHKQYPSESEHESSPTSRKSAENRHSGKGILKRASGTLSKKASASGVPKARQVQNFSVNNGGETPPPLPSAQQPAWSGNGSPRISPGRSLTHGGAGETNGAAGEIINAASRRPTIADRAPAGSNDNLAHQSEQPILVTVREPSKSSSMAPGRVLTLDSSVKQPTSAVVSNAVTPNVSRRASTSRVFLPDTIEAQTPIGQNVQTPRMSIANVGHRSSETYFPREDVWTREVGVTFPSSMTLGVQTSPYRSYINTATSYSGHQFCDQLSPKRTGSLGVQTSPRPRIGHCPGPFIHRTPPTPQRVLSYNQNPSMPVYDASNRIRAENPECSPRPQLYDSANVEPSRLSGIQAIYQQLPRRLEFTPETVASPMSQAPSAYQLHRGQECKEERHFERKTQLLTNYGQLSPIYDMSPAFNSRTFDQQPVSEADSNLAWQAQRDPCRGRIFQQSLVTPPQITSTPRTYSNIENQQTPLQRAHQSYGQRSPMRDPESQELSPAQEKFKKVREEVELAAATSPLNRSANEESVRRNSAQLLTETQMTALAYINYICSNGKNDHLEMMNQSPEFAPSTAYNPQPESKKKTCPCREVDNRLLDPSMNLHDPALLINSVKQEHLSQTSDVFTPPRRDIQQSPRNRPSTQTGVANEQSSRAGFTESLFLKQHIQLCKPRMYTKGQQADLSKTPVKSSVEKAREVITRYEQSKNKQSTVASVQTCACLCKSFGECTCGCLPLSSKYASGGNKKYESSSSAKSDQGRNFTCTGTDTSGVNRTERHTNQQYELCENNALEPKVCGTVGRKQITEQTPKEYRHKKCQIGKETQCQNVVTSVGSSLFDNGIVTTPSGAKSPCKTTSAKYDTIPADRKKVWMNTTQTCEQAERSKRIYHLLNDSQDRSSDITSNIGSSDKVPSQRYGKTCSPTFRKTQKDFGSTTMMESSYPRQKPVWPCHQKLQSKPCDEGTGRSVNMRKCSSRDICNEDATEVGKRRPIVHIRYRKQFGCKGQERPVGTDCTVTSLSERLQTQICQIIEKSKDLQQQAVQLQRQCTGVRSKSCGEVASAAGGKCDEESTSCEIELSEEKDCPCQQWGKNKGTNKNTNANPHQEHTVTTGADSKQQHQETAETSPRRNDKDLVTDLSYSEEYSQSEVGSKPSEQLQGSTQVQCSGNASRMIFEKGSTSECRPSLTTTDNPGHFASCHRHHLILSSVEYEENLSWNARPSILKEAWTQITHNTPRYTNPQNQHYFVNDPAEEVYQYIDAHFPCISRRYTDRGTDLPSLESEGDARYGVVDQDAVTDAQSVQQQRSLDPYTESMNIADRKYTKDKNSPGSEERQKIVQPHFVYADSEETYERFREKQAVCERCNKSAEDEVADLKREQDNCEKKYVSIFGLFSHKQPSKSPRDYWNSVFTIGGLKANKVSVSQSKQQSRREDSENPSRHHKEIQTNCSGKTSNVNILQSEKNLRKGMRSVGTSASYDRGPLFSRRNITIIEDYSDSSSSCEGPRPADKTGTFAQSSTKSGSVATTGSSKWRSTISTQANARVLKTVHPSLKAALSIKSPRDRSTAEVIGDKNNTTQNKCEYQGMAGQKPQNGEQKKMQNLSRQIKRNVAMNSKNEYSVSSESDSSKSKTFSEAHAVVPQEVNGYRVLPQIKHTSTCTQGSSLGHSEASSHGIEDLPLDSISFDIEPRNCGRIVWNAVKDVTNPDSKSTVSSHDYVVFARPLPPITDEARTCATLDDGSLTPRSGIPVEETSHHAHRNPSSALSLSEARMATFPRQSAAVDELKEKSRSRDRPLRASTVVSEQSKSNDSPGKYTDENTANVVQWWNSPTCVAVRTLLHDLANGNVFPQDSDRGTPCPLSNSHRFSAIPERFRKIGKSKENRFRTKECSSSPHGLKASDGSIQISSPEMQAVDTSKHTAFSEKEQTQKWSEHNKEEEFHPRNRSKPSGSQTTSTSLTQPIKFQDGRHLSAVVRAWQDDTVNKAASQGSTSQHKSSSFYTPSRKSKDDSGKAWQTNFLSCAEVTKASEERVVIEGAYVKNCPAPEDALKPSQTAVDRTGQGTQTPGGGKVIPFKLTLSRDEEKDESPQIKGEYSRQLLTSDKQFLWRANIDSHCESSDEFTSTLQ